jgi:acetyltransferase-like isoleucine patch superfamily enzyme
LPFIGASDYHELSTDSYSNNNSLGNGRGREGFKASPPGQWRAQNIQFNKMMQIFSPEITFGNPVFNMSTKLNIVGIQKESKKNNWMSEYNPVSKLNETEAKFTNGFTSDSPGVTVTSIIGNAGGLADRSIFGPTNSDHATGVFQFFREFKNGFVPTPNNGVKTANIYGAPEITEIGQDSKAYNGNSLFRYSNSLRAMLIDNWNESDSNNDAKIQVLGTNTYGAKCVTIMEGDNSSLTPIASRKSLEKIFTDAKFHEHTGGAGQLGPVYVLGTGTNSAMVVELAHDSTHAYLGGIYGGNSMEAKSRSSYLGIGPYSVVTNNTTVIDSPGDTYVGDFKFVKMTKTSTELASQDYLQVTEIISIPLETTVNLKRRNDISINDWDNRYQPKEVEYHNYNKVYTQQSTIIQSTGTGFKFKSINEFDTKVIASSAKIAGEFIDNWTNFLENETRTLDGRYGPINAVAKLGDEIYTLQDTAIAKLSIEPRVQTNATDGLSIQIGTGSVLNHHTYLSTESGTKNKWSVAATSNGIYYYDTINRSIGQIGQGVANITESAGFHSFMTNNTKLEDLVQDNPLIGRGVSIGYNAIDNEIYMTFLQSIPSYTIAYNESKKAFTSFYGYKPAIYINKGQRMITTNPDKNSGWQHFTGLRNTFYGVKHDSSITFLTAPGVDKDVVFNNAEYKMEMTNASGVDLPNSTFSSIRLWNEYQDTGEVSLVLRSNLKRRFRNWSIEFPRAMNGAIKTRDRIRNPWTYLKLTLNNPTGNKMIAHDITVSYTEY